MTAASPVALRSSDSMLTPTVDTPAVVDVSVLVPAKDEAENLPLFLEQCEAAFRNETVRYEVIVVDDGSTDATPAVLTSLLERFDFLRTARHRAQRGIADALRTGTLNSARDRPL